jgi:Rieske Fe-S protein
VWVLQGAMAQELQEGTYIQVYGNFKGGLAENPGALGPITVFAFYPVEDHNQVIQLSALCTHCGCSKVDHVQCGSRMHRSSK